MPDRCRAVLKDCWRIVMQARNARPTPVCVQVMVPTSESSQRHIVHVVDWAWSLGGIQSCLQHHLAHDRALGFEPHVLALFDRSVPADHPTRLAARAWTWVGWARRRFARLAAGLGQPRVMIYHDAWGMRWWAGCDGAERRIAYVHTEVPHLEERFRRAAPFMDGVVSVSQSMVDRLLRAVPDFPADRCWVIPYFVAPPPTPPDLRRTTGKTWRIGFAGRLEARHKRLDRLPALIAALDRVGLPYQFDVMGEGSAESDLRQILASHPAVNFLGRRSGDHYWRTLAEWDSMVLLSDYEGFGRVVMEGMMVGVLPVMPDYSPAATEVLGPSATHGLYPVGDMTAAAARVKGHAELSAADRAKLREAGARHFSGHTREDYNAVFAEALRTIREQPAHGRALPPAWWEPWLPLGLHTRLFPRRF